RTRSWGRRGDPTTTRPLRSVPSSRPRSSTWTSAAVTGSPAPRPSAPKAAPNTRPTAARPHPPAKASARWATSYAPSWPSKSKNKNSPKNDPAFRQLQRLAAAGREVEDSCGEGDVEEGEAQGVAEDSLGRVLALGGAELGEAGPAGERAFCAGEVHLRDVVGNAQVEGGHCLAGEGDVVVERAGECARADPARLDARWTAGPGRRTDDHVGAADGFLRAGRGLRAVLLREAARSLRPRRPGAEGPQPWQRVPERGERRGAHPPRAEDRRDAGAGPGQRPGGHRGHGARS